MFMIGYIFLTALNVDLLFNVIEMEWAVLIAYMCGLTSPLCDHIMDILPTVLAVVTSDNNISSIYSREHSRVLFCRVITMF